MDDIFGPPKTSTVSSNNVDDWLTGASTKSTSNTSGKSSAKNDDDWLLGGTTAKTTASSNTVTTSSTSAFGSTGTSSTSSAFDRPPGPKFNKDDPFSTGSGGLGKNAFASPDKPKQSVFGTKPAVNTSINTSFSTGFTPTLTGAGAAGGSDSFYNTGFDAQAYGEAQTGDFGATGGVDFDAYAAATVTPSLSHQGFSLPPSATKHDPPTPLTSCKEPPTPHQYNLQDDYYGGGESPETPQTKEVQFFAMNDEEESPERPMKKPASGEFK